MEKENEETSLEAFWLQGGCLKYYKKKKKNKTEKPLPHKFFFFSSSLLVYLFVSKSFELSLSS